MTLRNKLDDIDLKILDIITKNARIPFKDVAVIVKLWVPSALLLAGTKPTTNLH